MTSPTRQQPLRIETRHEDRVVVLGCDPCGTSVQLRTADGAFGLSVQAFCARHAGCRPPLEGPSVDSPAVIDLTSAP